MAGSSKQKEKTAQDTRTVRSSDVHLAGDRKVLYCTVLYTPAVVHIDYGKMIHNGCSNFTVGDVCTARRIVGHHNLDALS